MPIIRNVVYATVPSAGDERKLRKVAMRMQESGRSALIIDLTKNDLDDLHHFSGITHLTIRGGGRKCELAKLPATIRDLCLLDIEIDSVETLQCVEELRVLDYRFGRLSDIRGLARFANIRVLQCLRVEGLRGMDFLQAMTVLEWIEVSGCADFRQFPELRKLHSLRRVVVEDCEDFGDLSAISTASALEDVIVLGANKLRAIDFEGIASVATVKRVLPGIGKLNSREFLEACDILNEKAISGYYGGAAEFFEVRYSIDEQTFTLTVS